MHLTDCSDNQQGKHPHRERKIWTEGAEKEKRDVKCETEREERGGRSKKRGRQRKTIKMEGKMYCIYLFHVLFLVYMH